jgi:hypothetical protein
MEAQDGGHLVLIFPVIAKKGRVLFQRFRTANGVIDTAQAQNCRRDQVQHPYHKVGKDIQDFTARTNTPALASQMRQQDQSLLIHRFFGDKVSDLKQGHCSCPEDNQALVGNVSAE